MKKEIKKIARLMTPLIGINHLARVSTSNLTRIIMYHSFCTDIDNDLEAMPIKHFIKQLKFLKRNFQLFNISSVIEYEAKYKELPRNAAVITIDDGYLNFFLHAFPVLHDFEIPATIYVVAELTEKKDWIWTDKYSYIRKKIFEKNIIPTKIGELFSLEYLKTISTEERNILIKKMVDEFEVKLPENPPENYQLMSWQELDEVRRTDLIEIGSHSCTHPILSKLDSKDSYYEIYTSKKIIEKNLGCIVKSFCYPNGKLDDYTNQQMMMIEKAGYNSAVSANFGYLGKRYDKRQLPRLSDGGTDFSLFLKYVDGIEYYQNKILGFRPQYL